MVRILLIIVLFSAYAGVNNDYYEVIKKKSGLKEGEYLAVIYFDNITCAKCYLEPLEIVKQVREKNKNIILKIIALVKCDRDIELKVFKKRIKWEEPLHRDDGNAKKNLGAYESALLTVVNFEGDKLVHAVAGEMNKSIKKINKYLK